MVPYFFSSRMDPYSTCHMVILGFDPSPYGCLNNKNGSENQSTIGIIIYIYIYSTYICVCVCMYTPLSVNGNTPNK